LAIVETSPLLLVLGSDGKFALGGDERNATGLNIGVVS